MDYNEIEVNSQEIEQSLLNITDKSRTSNFAWKGQFSPEFIEVLLDTYADSQSIIYDPFVGSGTVVFESMMRNNEVLGIELNPAAYHMAKLYELGNKSNDFKEALITFFDEKINNIFTDLEFTDFINFCKKTNIDDAYDNIGKLLIVLSDIDKNSLEIDIVSTKWQKLKQLIREVPEVKKRVEIKLGDSRAAKFNSEYANLVITSPPYINVFNYHQNYRKSVELLGYDILNIAKAELGSNRKHRGNRFYTVIQYSIDMALSILETLRICKINSKLIYIVGVESTVLGYKLYNSRIIYNIFNQIFACEFSLKQQREFRNRYGMNIKEDILHFKKVNEVLINEHEVIDIARKIGIEELQRAVRYNENPDKKELLLQAISNGDKINKSEVISFG